MNAVATRNLSNLEVAKAANESFKQKFSTGRFVVLANNQPWKTLLDNKVIEDVGLIDDFAPDTGYMIKAGGETFFAKESDLKYAVGNVKFSFEAFVRGVRAITRNGGTAKFLGFDRKNLTYKVKAEVHSDGQITVQHYSVNGYLTEGIENALDLVLMKNPPDEEVVVVQTKGTEMPHTVKQVQDAAKQEVKSQEDKEKIEKELTELMEKQVQETEWTSWFFKYLKSGVEIEEIESCSVRELKDTVLKYSGKIHFKD